MNTVHESDNQVNTNIDEAQAFLEAILPHRDRWVVQVVEPAMKDGARVIGSDGKPKFWRNHYHFESTERDEMAEFILEQDAKGLDIFHACASYGPEVKESRGGRQRIAREQTNVTAVKAFWADIDIKPKDGHHRTREEALAALSRFCAAVNLPAPMVISSGRGLHCYWVLEAPISRHEWTPAAKALKRACDAHGLLVDPQRASDCSSVLRPVGSHWRKEDPARIVHRVSAGDGPIAFAQFKDALADYLDESDKNPLNGLGDMPESLKQLFANWTGWADLGRPEDFEHYEPADAERVADKCLQVRLVRDSQGDVGYEHWRLALGLLTFCEDTEQHAENWTARREETGHEQTDWEHKLATWRSGPPLCRSFDSANPAGCADCPHRGKINTPVALGRPTEVELDEEAKAKRREEQKEQARVIGEEGWVGSDTYDTAELINLEDAVEHFGFVTHGSQVIDLRNPRRLHCLADWGNAYCASTMMVEGAKKPVPVTGEWKKHLDRKTADNVTFLPEGGLLCNDPKGVRCFNVWRDIQRDEGNPALAQPFVDHIRHLWGEDAERFLDWLAHIEQKPGVLPHTGWLHIADHTGTGRNWLSSVLARVWAGHVASNLTVEDILGNFNDRLEAKLLAQVDEIREGGQSVWDRNEKFKSAMNPEYRTINPKYGRKRVEHNVCRFLLFSNSILAIPLDESDRRVEVVMHREGPRGAAYYTRLYGLLNDRAFINAVALWFRARDISQFNPGARARMTSAKELLVQANKSETVQRVETLLSHWPLPWMSQTQLKVLVMDDAEPSRAQVSHMLMVLRERGAQKVTTTRTRFPDGVLSEVWQIRKPEGEHAGLAEAQIVEAVRDTYLPPAAGRFGKDSQHWHTMLENEITPPK